MSSRKASASDSNSMILKWDARPLHVSVVRVLDIPRIPDMHEMRRESTVEKPLNDMLIGPGQEKTAAAARSLVIWGEELENMGAASSDDGGSTGVLRRSPCKNESRG